MILDLLYTVHDKNVQQCTKKSDIILYVVRIAKCKFIPGLMEGNSKEKNLKYSIYALVFKVFPLHLFFFFHCTVQLAVSDFIVQYKLQYTMIIYMIEI